MPSLITAFPFEIMGGWKLQKHKYVVQSDTITFSIKYQSNSSTINSIIVLSINYWSISNYNSNATTDDLHNRMISIGY